MRTLSAEELKVLYNEGEPLCGDTFDDCRDELSDRKTRKIVRILVGLAGAALLAVALSGCSIITKPCVTACLPGEICVAGACVPIPGPPPDPPAQCPAVCPEGQECKDPAKGCVPKPVEPTPDPEPVCEPNTNCECYVKPAGEDWKYLTCSADQQCKNHVCENKPPRCPAQCPPGQECKDPAKGCVNKPLPPPTSGAGAFPQGLASGDYTPVASVPTLHETLNLIMADLTGCTVGSNCRTNDTPVGFMWRVNSQLRARGFDAGRHEDDNSGAETGTDEITIGKRDSPCEWEGYHIAFYGVPHTVVWALPRSTPCHGHECAGGGAYRGNFVIPGQYCASPQPVPPGPPGTTPPPPSQNYGCPAPLPARVWTVDNLPPGWGDNALGTPAWKLNSHPHNKLIDTTAVTVNQEPYCRSIGMSPMADGTPRGGCPMRPECTEADLSNPDAICHDRLACERYVADGDWVLDSRNGATCTANPENSAQFYPNGGNCRLCNPAKTVCTDWY